MAATPAHNVGKFFFDAGGYAELDFKLYDTDGTRHSAQTADGAVFEIGTGITSVLTIQTTVNSSGSVAVITSSSNGLVTLKISATDSGTTLSATTYDFNFYITDGSDDDKKKYFARGQFQILSTLS